MFMGHLTQRSSLTKVSLGISPLFFTMALVLYGIYNLKRSIGWCAASNPCFDFSPFPVALPYFKYP